MNPRLRISILMNIGFIVLVLVFIFRSSMTFSRTTILEARNLPEDGKILFILGQDSETLHDFKTQVLDVAPDFPRPGGVTLYTNLVSAPLWGFYQPVEYGAGKIDFEGTLNEFGGALTVGLYLSTGDVNNQTPLLAIAGDSSVDPAVVERYRRWVDEMVLYLKATNRPVFLRIGYEFDNVWFWYQPEPYKAAFRYIKERIDALGADNVATVWQSAAYPYKHGTPDNPWDWSEEGHWEQWYPGDEYVDWIGFSYFYGSTYDQHQWSCFTGEVTAPPREIQDSLLLFARLHNKPVMIAEAAPAGFDIQNKTVSCIWKYTDPANRTTLTDEQIWNDWYAEFFDYVEDNRDIIRAIAYINTAWDTNEQPMWLCTGGNAGDPTCPSGYWGISTLQSNPYILDKFKQQLSKPIYALGSDEVPPFESPDFSCGQGVYEAEYAESSFGWFEWGGWGLYHGVLALPEPTAMASTPSRTSNGRHVQFLNYLGWEKPQLVFDNVEGGKPLIVYYSAINPYTTDNEGDFTVLINGQEIGTYHFTLTAGKDDYRKAVFDVAVPDDASITLRLDTVSSINFFVDKIEIGYRLFFPLVGR